MDNSRNSRTLIPLILILALIVLLLISGCVGLGDYMQTCQFENKTDQALSFFIRRDTEYYPNSEFIGNAAPGEKLKYDIFYSSLVKWQIAAKNLQSDIVYSRVFTGKELENMNFIVVLYSSDLQVQSIPFNFVSTLQLENETDQSLSFFIRSMSEDFSNYHFIDSAAPGEKVRYKIVYSSFSNWSIVAKNALEEVVYSREFTAEELEKMNFKLVIYPSDLQVQTSK